MLCDVHVYCMFLILYVRVPSLSYICCVFSSLYVIAFYFIWYVLLL